MVAVVVGSGPNGLAGAVRLAQAGVPVTVVEAAQRYGGGTRTSELTVPGVLHDDCSAFHPTALVSPYLTTLDLARHGLRWAWPEVDLAHPLDDGSAPVLSRDLDRTLASLRAPDARRWRRLFGPLSEHADALAEEVFGPVLHVPRHLPTLARFGAAAALPTTVLARWFDGEEARALLTGSAAHVFGRLDTPLSSAVGILLNTVGHRVGWPVAVGGSQAIADALVGQLRELGGEVVTGVRVTSTDQLRELCGRDPDVVLHDTTPAAAVSMLGERVPGRVRRQVASFRYGPAAFKVDLAVRGAVPWTNPDVRRAGTVHLGGSHREIVAAEGDTVRGRMPARPFVLLGQQHLADPSRSAGDVHPVWAYAHVPHGWTGDATSLVIDQVERFAPGFRDTIVAAVSRGPADLAAYNPNYVGGDIGIGANTARQVVLRPRPALDPYWLAPGHYLCSSAAPPGGGVHGMAGFHAAERALGHLRR